jgi:hypothetical protein
MNGGGGFQEDNCAYAKISIAYVFRRTLVSVTPPLPGLVQVTHFLLQMFADLRGSDALDDIAGGETICRLVGRYATTFSVYIISIGGLDRLSSQSRNEILKAAHGRCKHCLNLGEACIPYAGMFD